MQGLGLVGTEDILYRGYITYFPMNHRHSLCIYVGVWQLTQSQNPPILSTLHRENPILMHVISSDFCPGVCMYYYLLVVSREYGNVIRIQPVKYSLVLFPTNPQ